MYRVPKKIYFQNAARATRCTRSITLSWQPSQPDLEESVSGNYFGHPVVHQFSDIGLLRVLKKGQ